MVSHYACLLTRPPTGRYFSAALPSDCFAIDLPGRASSPGEGLQIFHFALREIARLSFTARIERPPLHRGGSASKKGTWPLPLNPSEAARCASTEDHQAPSPPLLREQGDLHGCHSSPSSCAFCKQEGWSGCCPPIPETRRPAIETGRPHPLAQ